MNSSFKIVFILILVLQGVNIFAQKKPATKNKKDRPKVTTAPPAQKPAGKIEILQANVAKYDTSYSEAHRLIGNVIFKHENMLMFCDSARFFEKESRIKAYGHIHVQQGDTLNVYADSLDYNGTTKLAKLRGHIRMVEKDLVMTCDSVDFDAKRSIGVYKGGATITSAKNKNTLTSRTGYYHSKTKDFYFKDNVVLKNQDSELKTDTLRYNVGNETAYFIAATKITTKDTGEITTTNGWFDTRKDKSAFYNRSELKKKEKNITADTILYDQKKGIGNLYGNAWMYDTTDKVGLFGDYAYYDEKKEEVLITRNPFMMQKFSKDTFYLKADTIFSVRDTSGKSTVKAYRNVKFFKGDMMGKADSLIYSDEDSLIKFFRQPVLWQDKNQLTGDYMEARVVDNKIQKITITNNSFIISKADTVGYNQIKGRNVYAYFNEEEISKIKVEGNGQTLYYIGEEGKSYSAINRADCSDIILYTKEGKIKRITFVYQPDATAYPIDKYPANEKLLKDFKWLEEQKPTELDFKPVIEFLGTR
ncbi:MAG TPA: OstA-like protein [Flavobacteriales bacterium]|nr:OstA-like protein [Flavobacteriales bacterium]